ncbi:response regulator [Deinococcus pimensis]|uniref:response regulator n=1 Tax=Deinococcus pimensis TaxID=309888 RepID=UPI0004800949|nr:response regulator [Deinococcus pimensis]
MTAFHVLLVEDSEADVLLVREAIDALDVEVRLHVVTNGEEALAYLLGDGAFHGQDGPDLVLLDSNMPRRNALEVLQVVRAQPTLSGLPIVVFSSSEASRDVEANLAAGASAYVTKPMSFDDFVQVVQETLRFWAARVLEA